MNVDFRELQTDLTRYIVREILRDEHSDVTSKTPLLETGILNSMNTFKLIAHIHLTYGVEIPPKAIVADNFRDLGAVAGLVVRLHEADQARRLT